MYINDLDYNINNYLYTVPYELNDNKVHINEDLHYEIGKLLNTPNIIKNNDYQFNIWLATGNHETGLHYDDNDNLLSVIKGEKNIILYPPSDTKYLYPYSVIPSWANTKALKFDYNMYKNLGEIENSFPSSRLLYELIICYDNKKLLNVIKKVVTDVGSNKLIFGCKMHNGIFRYELYIYSFLTLNSEIKNYQIYKNNKFDDYINQNNNICVRSFDFYNTDNVYGNQIHFYHNKDSEIKYPYYGYGTFIDENNNINKESVFVLDETNNIKKHIQEIIEKLNYSNYNVIILLNLLNLYNSKYLTIHNKFNDQYYIQYLDITCEDFIIFIQKYNYPKKFIDHVIENKNKYNNIKHEITIVFDLNGYPIRSAFYGLL